MYEEDTNPYDMDEESFEDAINKALGDEDNSSTDTDATNGEAEQSKQSDTSQTQQEDGTKSEEGSDPNAKGQEEQPKDQNTDNTNDIKFTDGSVISGGIARRHFARARRAEEQFNSMQEQFNNTQQQLQQAQQQVQAYEQANQVQKDLGINPNDAINAFKVLDAYKKNPVQAINYLIQAAKAQGKDLSQLGVGVDTAAIRGMIDEAVKPFRDRTQQEQEYKQRLETAQKEADQFLNANPGANVHVDTISKILKDHPGTTLNEAWLRVQNYYYKNGLPLDTPLSKIAEQRVQKQNTPNEPNRQAPNTQPTIATGNQSPRNYTPANKMAPSSQDWDDLIGEAISGINFGD